MLDELDEERLELVGTMLDEVDLVLDENDDERLELDGTVLVVVLEKEGDERLELVEDRAVLDIEWVLGE